MRIKFTISFTLFAIIICAANLASAQPITRTPLRDDVALSMQASVQDELQLSDAQKAAIVKLDEKARTQLTDLRELKLAPKERSETAAELAAQNTKALEGILRPDQFSRLNELLIQYRTSIDWTFTLTDKLADKLSLTAEQKTKLLDLSQEQKKAYPDKLRGTALEDIDRRARAIRAEQKKEALQILTQNQKQVFDILQGEEFDLTTIDDYAKPKKK
jgi:hypothetical protein